MQVAADTQILTVREAAERLKVSEGTAMKLFERESGVIVIAFPRKGNGRIARRVSLFQFISGFSRASLLLAVRDDRFRDRAGRWTALGDAPAQMMSAL